MRNKTYSSGESNPTHVRFVCAFTAGTRVAAADCGEMYEGGVVVERRDHQQRLLMVTCLRESLCRSSPFGKTVGPP